MRLKTTEFNQHFNFPSYFKKKAFNYRAKTYLLYDTLFLDFLKKNCSLPCFHDLKKNYRSTAIANNNTLDCWKARGLKGE